MLKDDGRWLIDKEQAHHLLRVRRCTSGSLAEGLESGEKISLLLLCEGDEVYAEELSRTAEKTSLTELHLMLAVLKNDQFDQALRFAAETGVYKIWLISCERSVPKYSGTKLEVKMARWRKILDESTKQSGAATPPTIMPPVRLDEFDTEDLPGCRFAAMLSSDAYPLSKQKIKGPAVVAIGPEGDWSPNEAGLLILKGFVPVSLGNRILRASTAVAVACGWFSMN